MKNQEKKSNIFIILDRSGSMGMLAQETIDVFNEQIKAIQEGAKDVKTKVSLVTFSTDVDEPLIWSKSPRNLKKLTSKDYRPGGMTALYDAVGSTISKIKAKEDENYLFIIITDGYENNSKEFTGGVLPSKISELQKAGNWTFSYFGSNQDLSEVSKVLNIPISNMSAYASSKRGVKNMSHVMCMSTTSYMQKVSDGDSLTADFIEK